MYETLTTQELNLLQQKLFHGVQAAYKAANLRKQDPGWLKRHAAVHSEVGCIFLEAGKEFAHRFTVPRQLPAS